MFSKERTQSRRMELMPEKLHTLTSKSASIPNPVNRSVILEQIFED